jgi:hypothetical protein
MSTGYRNPPKNIQFRKGRSGNPKGRPRQIQRRQFPWDTCFARLPENPFPSKSMIGEPWSRSGMPIGTHPDGDARGKTRQDA